MPVRQIVHIFAVNGQKMAMRSSELTADHQQQQVCKFWKVQKLNTVFFSRPIVSFKLCARKRENRGISHLSQAWLCTPCSRRCSRGRCENPFLGSPPHFWAFPITNLFFLTIFYTVHNIVTTFYNLGSCCLRTLTSHLFPKVWTHSLHAFTESGTINYGSINIWSQIHFCQIRALGGQISQGSSPQLSRWWVRGAGWVCACLSERPPGHFRVWAPELVASSSRSRLWGRRHIWPHACQDTCEYHPQPPPHPNPM